MNVRTAPAPTFTFKRLALALLAVAALLTPLLLRDGGVGAQTTTTAPAFYDAAFTSGLDAGADGSGTAIVVGKYPYSVSSGAGTPTHVCAIGSAVQNGSVDPADFATTATAPLTDVSADFAVTLTTDGNYDAGPNTGVVCQLTYTGEGLQGATFGDVDDDSDANTDAANDDDDPDNPDPQAIVATHPVVSVAITLHDSLDSTGGADTTTIDSTINVTVRLTGLGTDQAAVEELYRETGGSSWTRKGGFTDDTLATFPLTTGTSGTLRGFGANFGATRDASATITRNGRTYRLVHFYHDSEDRNLSLGLTSDDLASLPGFVRSLTVRDDFKDLKIRVGSDRFFFTTPPTEADGVYSWRFYGGGTGGADDFPQRSIDPGTGTLTRLPPFAMPSGAFDLHIFSPGQRTLSSAWHGVTVPAGQRDSIFRLTELDLSDNNLTGTTLPDSIGLLTQLTKLDLSGNPNLRGRIPLSWTAMLNNLTYLDLTGSGVCVDTATDTVNRRLGNWANGNGRASNAGVVGQVSCGPQFNADAATLRLDAGEDGSGAAISLGALAFRGSSYTGATNTCAVSAAAENGSDDPADHDVTTGTASTDFDAAAGCVIRYTGAGATRTAGTLEAYSLTVTITDAMGDTSTTDDTINVTVRLLDATTDDAALDDFYTATAGASWTAGGTGLTGEWTGTLAASWHGVTLDANGRVSGLDLDNNNLVGSISDLGDLTKLTSLELSGNPSLTLASAGLTGLRSLASLTSFLMPGSGVCEEAEPAAGSFAMTLSVWLNGLRASGASVIVVPCDSGGPTFTEDLVVYTLDAGTSSSVVLGAPAFTAGTAPNGTTYCVGASARLLGDVETFDLSGADVSTLFTIDTSTCALEYVSGADNSAYEAGVREGFALSLTIRDGVNGGGQTDESTDDTMRVIVKLLSPETDRAALDALYGSAGGRNWTTRTQWNVRDQRITLSGKLDSGEVGYNSDTTTTRGGVQPYISYGTPPGSSPGTPPASATQFTLGGTTYTLVAALRVNSSGNFVMRLTPEGDAAHFTGVSVRIGTPGRQVPPVTPGDFNTLQNQAVTLAFDDATRTEPTGGSTFTWSSGGPALGALQDQNFDVVILAPPLSTRHGVTVNAAGRVTALDLNENNLRGSLPALLGELSLLTNLDLSGNANLGGTIPAELDALPATATTSIDLGGDAAGATTGLCVDPARDARVEAWLLDIRTEGGTIRAATCGSPDSPAFAQDTDLVRLDAGDDGSTTAIAIGTYDFSASTFGMSVPLCNVVAIENPSANPADHLTAGTANTDFTTHTDAANLSCDVTYTGTAPDSLAAYSLAVTISDNVNADNTGAADPAVDDTIAVTVKLLNIRTDQAALMALYRATGGDAWTANANWADAFAVEHTFGMTPGTGTNFVGVAGTQVGSLSNRFVTVGGTQYEVDDLQRYNSGPTDGNLRIAASPGPGTTDFAGKSFRIKGNVYSLASGDTTGSDVNFFIVQWTNTPESLFTAGTAVNVDLGTVNGPPSAVWTGVTVGGTPLRVTGLSLPNNGLRGRLPGTALAELTRLTSLDLSDNDRLTGTVPDLSATALATLDLEGTRIERGANRAAREWLASPGLTFTPGDAPRSVGSSAAPPGSVTVSVAATGATAPAGATYLLRLACGAYSFDIALAAGGSYTAPVDNGSSCALTATESRGASRVSGLFGFLGVNGPVFRAVVFTHPAAPADDGEEGDPAEDEPGEEEPGEEDPVEEEPEEEPVEEEPVEEEPVDPNPQLEAELVIGNTYVAWSGESTPVAEAVRGLTLRVTAIYRWDARGQRWLSWFPNAEGLGVNTLATLEPRGIYGIYAQERARNGN